MDIATLKEAVNTCTLPNDFLVLLCNGTHFTALQYVHEICNTRGVRCNRVESVADTINNLSAVFDFTSDNADINLIIAETFSESFNDYEEFKNTIVVCDKIDKKIKSDVEPFVVEIPKLQDWNIYDYIYLRCPELTDYDVKWLYNATGGDISRIDNELDKIILFDENERRRALIELKTAPESDLFEMSIFDLSEAIIRHDRALIIDGLDHITCCDFEPVGLVKILLNKYKNLVLVRAVGATPDTIGISPKQFNFLKNYYRNINEEELIKNIEFLSSVDFRLKMGKLELNKEDFLLYIITNILANKVI